MRLKYRPRHSSEYYMDKREYCDDNWEPYIPPRKKWYPDPISDALYGTPDRFELNWDNVRGRSYE